MSTFSCGLSAGLPEQAVQDMFDACLFMNQKINGDMGRGREWLGTPWIHGRVTATACHKDSVPFVTRTWALLLNNGVEKAIPSVEEIFGLPLLTLLCMRTKPCRMESI